MWMVSVPLSPRRTTACGPHGQDGHDNDDDLNRRGALICSARPMQGILHAEALATRMRLGKHLGAHNQHRTSENEFEWHVAHARKGARVRQRGRLGDRRTRGILTEN
jgi:hypothetical protein